MIRFIIKRREHDGHNGMTTERFYTIDCDVPDLESALLSGGYGEVGYEVHELVGAELRVQP